ncbi:Uncharacterised protein [Mycobacteroides abscessus subsp. abscessus]|nr:Uncharacterised protein [Mycobacteroides abscessus subsp. abscessus]
MPWSGSVQRRCTAATMACTSSQSASGSALAGSVMPLRSRACASVEIRSTIGPKTSSCTCMFAALPTRTGREPAYPGSWSITASGGSVSP